jgi:hypothetical protein
MRFLSYNHIGIVFKPCLSYIYFFSFKHIVNHASRQVRHRSGGLPMNTMILFVPQQINQLNASDVNFSKELNAGSYESLV